MTCGRVAGVKLKIRVLGEEEVVRVTVYMVILPRGRSGGAKETWIMEDEKTRSKGDAIPSGAGETSKNNYFHVIKGCWG